MHYFGETEVEVERQPTVPLDTTRSSDNEVTAAVTAVVSESLVEVENESEANSGAKAITTEVSEKKKKKDNKIDTDFEDYKNKNKLSTHRLQLYVPKGDDDTDEAREEVNSCLH
jgi:hypothetical protein